jgi:endonuclease/exonuclease/phosphatase (EEP) superfamily protein YafD
MAAAVEGHDLTIRRIALLAFLALWLALLAAYAGRFAWFLDLFAHFRVQYTALFLICAAVLLAVGLRAAAIAACAGAVLSAWPLAGYVALPPQVAAAGAERFRVVSFNVWFRNHDLTRIAAYLEQTDADAIVLQELGASQAQQLRALLKAYPHSYVEPRRYGAALFTRWPIVASQSMLLSPDGARGVHAVLDWRGSPVALLGVHLHWPLGPDNSRLRNQELGSIAAFARNQHVPLIVAGDFNITPWSAHYGELLRASSLSDCAAERSLAPTWPSQFPPLGISIDHCLFSREWRSLDVRLGPSLGSDHRALIADLRPTSGQ